MLEVLEGWLLPRELRKGSSPEPPLAVPQLVPLVGYSLDICGSMDSVLRGVLWVYALVLPTDGQAEGCRESAGALTSAMPACVCRATILNIRSIPT